MELVLDATTILCLCIVILLYSFYKYSAVDSEYCKRRDVEYVLESLEKFIINKVGWIQGVYRIYKMHPNERYVGFFASGHPLLLLRDPLLIRKIVTTDFGNFLAIDHTTKDFIVHKTLSYLHWSIWSNIKVEMTKVLTSGNVQELIQGLCTSDSLHKVFQDSCAHHGEVDVYRITSEYISSVICSFIFGCDPEIDLNSRKGRDLFHFSLQQVIQTITDCKMDSTFAFLDVSNSVKHFVLKYFKDVVRHRESSGQRRHDFLQIYIDQKKSEEKKQRSSCNESGKTKSFLDDEVLGYFICIVISSIFEKLTNLICLCLYELALNPDVQETLRFEIMKAVDDKRGDVIYERLCGLKYSHSVILETLRKYPVVYGTIRTCTKDYKVPGSDLVIEKGITVFIPIYSIHRDPAYYTDPEIFDPDRFNELSIQERESGTYIPFGEGPRFCIGSDFSILLMKLALVQILSRFSFTAFSKTKVPVEFSMNSNHLSMKNGLWLKVEKLSR